MDRRTREHAYRSWVELRFNPSLSATAATGNWINYQTAVSGDLQLCPTGPAHDALSDDYGRMLGDGMLLDDAESFEELIKRCAHIEARANKLAAGDKKQS